MKGVRRIAELIDNRAALITAGSYGARLVMMLTTNNIIPTSSHPTALVT